MRVVRVCCGAGGWVLAGEGVGGGVGGEGFTSKRARYGRCHVGKRMELCVQ